MYIIFQKSPLDNAYVIEEIVPNQWKVCSGAYGKFQAGVSQLGLRSFKYEGTFKYNKAVGQVHDYREKAGLISTAGLLIDYCKIWRSIN